METYESLPFTILQKIQSAIFFMLFIGIEWYEERYLQAAERELQVPDKSCSGYPDPAFCPLLTTSGTSSFGTET